MASYFEMLVICLILLLPFLYETSHSFRYYLKFFVYYIWVTVCSLLIIPVMMFRPFNVKNLLLSSFFCSPVTHLIGLKWELRGKEHLEKDQACVIIANHQSSLDILGMFVIWPIMNKVTVVAKRELFYFWPFGLGAWLGGIIFINRMQGDKAKLALNNISELLKLNKIKLWIFPEGTRYNTGEIHQFKKGAFHLAINSKLPIIPVVYSSYLGFLDNTKHILNSGKIIITVLPAISTTDLNKDDLPKLMNDVHCKMLEVYKITSTESLCKKLNQKVDQKQSDDLYKNDELFEEFKNQKTLKNVIKAQ